MRVTRVKFDKERKASSEQELKFFDEEHRDLEEAISEQLEQAGLKNEGWFGVKDNMEYLQHDKILT